MSAFIYDASVPTVTRNLKVLSALLDKAAAYAEAKKFEPKALLEARLFPNMYPLLKQVQVVCDLSKGTVARLVGVEPPKHEDSETTIADLKARIAKTLDFVESTRPAQMQDAAGRSITLTFPTGSMSFTGMSYLTDFALPNLYFHLSMAYAILRHNGLELGKRDFLSPPQ